MIPPASSSLGLWVTYVVLYFLLFFACIFNFVHCFKLKTGRITHLVLFAMAMGDALFGALARAVQCSLVRTAVHDPKYLTVSPVMLSAYGDLIAVGYAFQNSIIVYLVFLWVEVFVNTKAGNLEMQARVARRYTWARSFLVFSIWMITFWTTYAAVTNQAPGSGGIDLTLLWIGSAICGVVILPIIIVAGVRWRSLYDKMKDHQGTKTQLRFLDLSKASLCAVFSFFMDNLFFGVLNSDVVEGNIVSYVFLSLIPDLQLIAGVCWFYSPLRKFQYMESDPASTGSSSGPKTETSGVGSGTGNMSSTSDSGRLSLSVEIDSGAVVSGSANSASVNLNSDEVDA